MWNTKRRKRRVRRNKSVSKNNGMIGSLLLVAVAIIVVIFTNMPKEQRCMSNGCTNSRREKGVYCTEHQLEFEEYKTKAYNYENCTITYSTESLQCGVKHTSDTSHISNVEQYEFGEK